PVEAGDQAGFYGIGTNIEDDWNCCGRFDGCPCRKLSATCDDDGYLQPDQLLRQFPRAIVFAATPPELDRYILALDVARLIQPWAEGSQHGDVALSRSSAEVPDHRHCRLLRARRDRPSDCCATEKRDELAPPHSITSSARASTDGG